MAIPAEQFMDEFDNPWGSGFAEQPADKSLPTAPVAPVLPAH